MERDGFTGVVIFAGGLIALWFVVKYFADQNAIDWAAQRDKIAAGH
jgi:hypothetical protein